MRGAWCARAGGWVGFGSGELCRACLHTDTLQHLTAQRYTCTYHTSMYLCEVCGWAREGERESTSGYRSLGVVFELFADLVNARQHTRGCTGPK